MIPSTQFPLTTLHAKLASHIPCHSRGPCNCITYKHLPANQFTIRIHGAIQVMTRMTLEENVRNTSSIDFKSNLWTRRLHHRPQR